MKIKYIITFLLLIVLDQLSKLLVYHYIKPGFAGQIKLIGDLIKIHYVMNPSVIKDTLTGVLAFILFKLALISAIVWCIFYLNKRKSREYILWTFLVILAGVIGNTIDSTFYGVWLNNAPHGSSTPWFHGQVIDMIFIDFWEGFIPEEVPGIGGTYYSTPIFNLSDAYIYVGINLLLIYKFIYEKIYFKFKTNTYQTIELSQRFDSIDQLIHTLIQEETLQTVTPVRVKHYRPKAKIMILLSVLLLSLFDAIPIYFSLAIIIIFFISLWYYEIKTFFKPGGRFLDLLIVTNYSLYLVSFIKITRKSNYFHLYNVVYKFNNNLIKQGDFEIDDLIPDSISSVQDIVFFVATKNLDTIKEKLMFKFHKSVMKQKVRRSTMQFNLNNDFVFNLMGTDHPMLISKYRLGRFIRDVSMKSKVVFISGALSKISYTNKIDFFADNSK